MSEGFGTWITDHKCGTCGFPLYRVWPSKMLTCYNPACDAEPMFLIPPEKS